MPMTSKVVLVFFCLVTLAAATLFAAEKEGLRVEVVPKMLSDSGPLPNYAQSQTPVDQDMSLKATIKNVSMKDAPEGSIDYIVLVQRWGTETAAYSSYKGTEKLPGLRFADQVEVDIGKYHLGGHLHGSSEQHKDKLAGWKIVVTQGDKKVEFISPPNFETLNKTAKPDRERRSGRQ